MTIPNTPSPSNNPPPQFVLSPEIASQLLNSSATPSHVTNLIPLKLTKENYLLWKDITTIVLQNYEMYGIIDGSEPCPPQFLNNNINPAYTQWVKKDRTCRIWLIASLSESVLPFTVGSTSASSLWLTLERRLAALTRSHVLQLKRRIQTIQKGSLSITDYLQQIKAVADALAAAGAPLDDSDLVAHILHGLTDDYEAFTTSIRVRSEPVTADELHGLLLSQEIEIEHRANPTALFQPNNNSQVFTASTSSRPRNTNRFPNQNTRPNSHRPRYPNNTSRFSNVQNRQQNLAPLLPTPPNPLPPYPQHSFAPSFNPRPNLRPPRCQLCGLNNHRAPECFHRFNHAYQGRLPPPRLAAMMAPTHGYQHPRNATASFTPEDQLDASSSLWYLDSGATNHVTSDLNHLNIHTPYTGSDTVTIGNGEGSSNGADLFRGPTNATGLYPIRLTTSSQTLNRLTPRHQLKVSGSSTSSLCSSCQLGRKTKLPFLPSSCVTTGPLQLIHTDVWGPAPLSSISGFKYYVIFVDDWSRFTWLFPLRFKSEVFSTFQQFKHLVENQFDLKIKVMRCDNGGEYTSAVFQSFLSSHGIAQQFTCPHTPEQNGMAERKHRHIIELTRTLFAQSSLPLKFWVEVVQTSVYLINRLPSSSLDFISPLQKLFHCTPDYYFLKSYGCACYPWLKPYSPHKFAYRSCRCVFIGYGTQQKGYRCLDPISGKVYISRHVTLRESITIVDTFSRTNIEIWVMKIIMKKSGSVSTYILQILGLDVEFRFQWAKCGEWEHGILFIDEEGETSLFWDLMCASMKRVNCPIGRKKWERCERIISLKGARLPLKSLGDLVEEPESSSYYSQSLPISIKSISGKEKQMRRTSFI